jgi:hypothetical protein
MAADQVQDPPLESGEGSKSFASSARFSASKTPAAKTSSTKPKTEAPSRPYTTTELPEQAASDTLAIGNKEYELMIRSERRFGVFYERDYTENPFKWATLNCEQLRISATATLSGVFRRLLLLDDFEADENILTRTNRMVRILVRGICLATYYKIRAVNYAFNDEGHRYMFKPKIPNPLEIPKPFALAIQMLGAVEIHSMTRRTIAVPGLTTADAATACLATGEQLIPALYAQAVEYAKKKGLQFATVNFDVKYGSAWWLLNCPRESQIPELQVRLPESNFTESDALMHLMFCALADGSFGSPLFTLGELNNADYGTIVRNPHAEANVSSFFAFSDEPLSNMWKIDG